MIIFPSPQTKTWTQPNSSDLFGSLWSVRGINLDRPGYLELSNASVGIEGSDTIGFALNSNSANSTTSGGVGPNLYIASIGGSGGKLLQVSNLSTTSRLSTINVTGQPTIGIESSSTTWKDRWYVSYNNSLAYFSLGSWFSTGITLSGSALRPLEVFKNRDTICVGDGRAVQQFNTSHVSTGATLSLQENVTGLAYNNNLMAVTTTAPDTQGEAFFYTWDGGSSQANNGVPVGANAILGMCAYLTNSWVILTSKGQLLKYNGSGFTKLAEFPWASDRRNVWTNSTGASYSGDNSIASMCVQGERILINVNTFMDITINKEISYKDTFASGIWCYEPSVGLYHKFNRSGTVEARTNLILTTNVDISTDTITVTLGNVPITGTPCKYSPFSTSFPRIGNLFSTETYYVIKITSNTMKLASSKTDSLNNIAINLTSTGSNNQSFIFYPTIDYGHLLPQDVSIAYKGFIKPFDANPFSEIMFSSITGNSIPIINSIVAGIENRGTIVTPKLYSASFKDIWKKINIKYSGVTKDIDLVRVKYKDELYPNIYGTSGSSVVFSNLISTNSTTLTTTGIASALSEPIYVDLIKYLTNGASTTSYTYVAGDTKEIEMTVINGKHSGSISKVTSIIFNGTEYVITLNEALVGPTFGNLNASFDIWKTIGDITSADIDGYKELPIETVSKFIQFKLELRGYGVVIEEIQIINEPHTLSS